jgi:hypothetical protein
MCKAAEDRRVHGKVEVRIVQDQQCAVAAKFEDGFLQVAAGNSSDMTTHSFGSGERNDARNGMIDKRIANFANIRDDHVQQSLGNSSLFENLGNQRSAGDRRVVMRLQHYTIPSSQRGCYRSHAEVKGKIERTDHPDHAGGDAVKPVFLAVDG